MVLTSSTGLDSRVSFDESVLARVVGRAHELSSLPAIATTDWAERAAVVFGAAVGSFAGYAAVLVVELNAGGTVSQVETTGVVWYGRNAGAPAPSGVPQAATELARLTTLGWDARSQAVRVGLLSAVLGSERWSSSPLAAALGGARGGEPLLAVGPLGQGQSSRLVIVVLSPDAGTGFEPQDAAVVRALMPILLGRAYTAFGDSESRVAAISDREQVVLNQLIMGKSVRQIAEELGRSPHTVHDHVKSLHRKLNASSRGELIARALGHVSKATRIRDTGKPGPRTAGPGA